MTKMPQVSWNKAVCGVKQETQLVSSLLRLTYIKQPQVDFASTIPVNKVEAQIVVSRTKRRLNMNAIKPSLKLHSTPYTCPSPNRA